MAWPMPSSSCRTEPKPPSSHMPNGWRVLDREAASRNTRRFQTRLRAARLRHSQAAIEDVDYRTPRRLDKALFQQFATSRTARRVHKALFHKLAPCRWIAEHRGLLISGPCGVGKSWLSCALAQKA